MRNAGADLSADDLARLEAAHSELRRAVAAYERCDGDHELRVAQEAVSAAQDRLWELREELLDSPRPSWAPRATLISDWFSEEDAIYDDLPEPSAS